jgi:hypothetical protein
MMTRLRYVRLVVATLGHLALFDVAHSLFGFQATLRLLGRVPEDRPVPLDIDPVLSDAVLLATCLYWKRVLCLQRSFCMTRLLRARGIPARLVIGYRPVPFFSHAWVELNGRVVNDSQAYRQRLHVLHTV